ncbi:hypothetical protein [Arthrobacter cavernae]|uniref:Uncharacterized protein n=1 Tax=Arthrobacter cavernae TaxID=2817681 RepID=A0A939HE19_9MICC|nr:hypothetical protein [Arthrobacter cavernae]MBO1269154.1 hypothetical protein [Arthrobacter cavernae]
MALQARTLRRRLLVPFILLTVLGGLLVGVLASGTREPAIPLGASASIGGGLARINGVIPLEVDGWVPNDGAPLAGSPADGMHRVRILLELTALEPAGITIHAADYSILGIGAGKPKPVWSSPVSATVKQGQTIDVTLVFELPDKAIALTLQGPDGAGLSLGPGHHRGG